MTDIQKDILVGLLFIIGILSFISGAFLIASLSFAAVSVLSNAALFTKAQKSEPA